MSRDPYQLRNVVGRWLRIRAEHPGTGTDASVFHQLAADAEHSDLLARLFSGEEPLSYEEWQAGRSDEHAPYPRGGM